MHNKHSLLAKQNFFQYRNVRFFTFLIVFSILGLAKVNAQSTQEFKFTLEAGDDTKSIVVSFVRVVQAGTINQAASIPKLRKNKK